jgi:hypothetical protein
MRLAPILLLVSMLATLALAAPARAAGRLRVLVLDVKSSDLQPGEVETLTSLVTAHLARYPQLDVMSGADIKRLVDLEAQKQSVGCDEGACLAELAGAMGAELVFYGQAGRLGSTIVVTLNAYDAKRGAAVGRQPIEARDLGQLPMLIGPAVDRLVKPLFEGLRAGPRSHMGGPGDDGTVRGSPVLSLGARGREVYDAQEMSICVDERNRVKWWYCDKTKAWTENDFVRGYRELTGRNDLDKHERNRNPEGLVIPVSLIAGGGVLALAGVPITWYSLVDKTSFPVLAQGGETGLGATVGLSALAIGAGAAIYGGIMMGSALKFTDGEVTDHSLKESSARTAVERYNEALAQKIAAEYEGQ